ncbi:hypothetical protein [Dankookia sp. P2]|uniref:hypothetical protein n=1 Tax=Dankookia sp. P2 TaxID=3423955 RepID=UPI003D66758B
MKRDRRPKRITFTIDERGSIYRVCADEEVEVYIVDPHARQDRVYRWTSTKFGAKHVDKEIDEWPISDKHHMPVWH